MFLSILGNKDQEKRQEEDHARDMRYKLQERAKASKVMKVEIGINFPLTIL
jgi:hypothetical protein